MKNQNSKWMRAASVVFAFAVQNIIYAQANDPKAPPAGKNLPPTPPAAAVSDIPPPPPVPSTPPTAPAAPPVAPTDNHPGAPAEKAVDNNLPPPEDLPIPDDEVAPTKPNGGRGGGAGRPGGPRGPGGPGGRPGAPEGRVSATKPAPDTAKVVVEEKSGAAKVPPGQELVNIDFPEPTEIKDIVRAVALWMNKNVILDRNVSGKIQIISPKKVTKEEAYQAFLSALNILQFTTVETGKVIKIVPIRQAVRGNLRTFMGSKWTPLTDEIITQIVPLKYVDAKSIQNTLSRIVTTNALIAYEKTNTLIISDSGYKVRRILDILELIDVQGQQPQVSIVPILHADAKGISEKVNEILKANAAAGSTGGQNFKIMQDERTNSVIIFGPPRTIADVTNLVKKFDIELTDPANQATVHVRPLDYADAKKIATTLSALAQGNKNSSRRSPPTSFGGITGAPGAPPTSSSRPNEPADVAELSGDVKITADESTNALLITGSRAGYQAVNSIVRKLDIRRSQVFVEADILDVNVDGMFSFKSSIFGGTTQGDNKVLTTWQAKEIAPVVVGQATASTPGATVSDDTRGKVAGAFAEDMSIGILSGRSVTIPGLGTFSPGALIKMIKSDSNTRVLSSPHVLTANNEESKFSVGQLVFYKNSDTNLATGASVAKVEKEKVDLTMTLKPNISNSNYVTLKVELEQNELINSEAQTSLPNISTRKTSQIITAKNAQTIVISGLVKTTQSEAFYKIPLLGDIPIIGWLFRNSKIVNNRSNLMIFLTPHVVHGADDLATIYQNKIKQRDEFMEQVYGSGFKDDRFYAMLPNTQDGTYSPDSMDDAEKRRRDDVLKTLYDEPGQQTPEAKEAAKAEAEAKKSGVVPVPANATVGGAGGSDGGASLAAPPAPGAPVPPAPGGDDGGGDFPPPPEDLPPPPPPPGPEND